MSNEVRTAESMQLQSPIGLLQMALEKDFDVDRLGKLIDFQKSYQAEQARLSYNAALSRVQEEVHRVAPDRTNTQTSSRYATLAAMDREIRPVYTREGFSLSFDSGESTLPDHLRLLCHVSHLGGHTHTYHVDIPADGKGAKGGDVMTKTHAMGSAISYGRRYLYGMIFNLAIGVDDDGNGAGAPIQNSQELAGTIKQIAEAKTMPELSSAFNTAYTTFKDEPSRAQIREAKDKRQSELKAQR